MFKIDQAGKIEKKKLHSRIDKTLAFFNKMSNRLF